MTRELQKAAGGHKAVREGVQTCILGTYPSSAKIDSTLSSLCRRNVPTKFAWQPRWGCTPELTGHNDNGSYTKDYTYSIALSFILCVTLRIYFHDVQKQTRTRNLYFLLDTTIVRIQGTKGKKFTSAEVKLFYNRWMNEQPMSLFKLNCLLNESFWLFSKILEINCCG